MEKAEMPYVIKFALSFAEVMFRRILDLISGVAWITRRTDVQLGTRVFLRKC